MFPLTDLHYISSHQFTLYLANPNGRRDTKMEDPLPPPPALSLNVLSGEGKKAVPYSTSRQKKALCVSFLCIGSLVRAESRLVFGTKSSDSLVKGPAVKP